MHSILFGVAIFLSSFLLFLIQPISAKALLPHFGGSPAVWNACMLFFQLFLLLGYLAAQIYAQGERRKITIISYCLLLFSSLIFFSFTPSLKSLELSDWPALQIVIILASTLGLPYLILASTSPLIQHWYAQFSQGKSAYRLYALSNVGSLLSLLLYPFLIEPILSLQNQLSTWLWLYRIDVLFLVALSILSFIFTKKKKETSLAKSDIDFLQGVLWFALPATSTALLLSITNFVCHDLANVPFLWVFPLSIFLLSYILCFDGRNFYQRRFYVGAGIFLVVVLFNLHLVNSSSRVVYVSAVSFLALFVCCMLAHGELYRLRPEEKDLTRFYVGISAGGVAGGFFVSILAPLIFLDYHELACSVIILILCLLAVLYRYLRAEKQALWRSADWKGLLLVSFALISLLLISTYDFDSKNTIDRRRNFFGVLKINKRRLETEKYDVHSLVHGNTIHGLQSQDPEKKLRPTSYYGPTSGIGLTLTNFKAHTSRRVAILGLGVGTTMVYGRERDYFRIYEIDPDVVSLAKEQFSYLSKTKAKFEIVLGDARKSLEKELPQNFDIIFIDVFSSDAIPVHLLTKEAFEVYLSHLSPKGVVVINISNRHLNLFPVVRSIAIELGLKIREVIAKPEQDESYVFESQNVLLSRDEKFFQKKYFAQSGSRDELSEDYTNYLWTDDYSSLFRVLSFE